MELMNCSQIKQLLQYGLVIILVFCISSEYSEALAQEPVPFDAAALGLEIPTVSPGDGVALPIVANTIAAPPGVAMPEEMVMNSPFDVAMESIFGEANIHLRTFKFAQKYELNYSKFRSFHTLCIFCL